MVAEMVVVMVLGQSERRGDEGRREKEDGGNYRQLRRINR